MESRIEAITERTEYLQNKIWSAQDPQEQLQKKAAKGQRLKMGQADLMEKIKKSQEEEQKAREEADRHEAEGKKLTDLYHKNEQEIARLNVSSQTVVHGLVQGEANIGQLVSMAFAHRAEKLKVFDDALYAGDQSVVDAKNEILAAQELIKAQSSKMDEACEYLQSFAASFRTRAAEEATRKAAEAAKQATEANKAAEAATEAAEAKKTAGAGTNTDPASPPAEGAGASKAKTPGETLTETKTDEATGEKKERTDGKSRSPPPRRGAGSTGESKPTAPRSALEAAVAKPVRQRTNEEVLLVGAAGKVGKWSDGTVMDDDEADL